jgi:hypothetical protein
MRYKLALRDPIPVIDILLCNLRIYVRIW